MGDAFALALSAPRSHPLRSLLTAGGVAIGIAAVILLTSIGTGIHRFVLAEFTQFGTHLLAVTPGKTTTAGISGAVIGSVKPLTLEDAESLRTLSQVRGIVAVLQGNAEAEAGSRQRRTTVIGTGHEAPEVWRFGPAIGNFLPADDVNSARALAVLGAKLSQELFGAANPLGARIRVGGQTFRVIGVMQTKGQVLGFDLDDAVYIPTARALELFNREGVMEVDVLYAENIDLPRLVSAIKSRILSRHGREDFTITTQDQMLDVLSSVLNVLTFAVAALGGISLLVGGIGIFTIMTIAVTERIAEIGLLRALGAYRRQVLWLFMGEALLLSTTGGVIGLLLGFLCAGLLSVFVPALPVHVSWSYTLGAFAVSVAIGIIAGVIPARAAARFEPVEALRYE